MNRDFYESYRQTRKKLYKLLFQKIITADFGEVYGDIEDFVLKIESRDGFFRISNIGGKEVYTKFLKNYKFIFFLNGKILRFFTIFPQRT